MIRKCDKEGKCDHRDAEEDCLSSEECMYEAKLPKCLFPEIECPNMEPHTEYCCRPDDIMGQMCRFKLYTEGQENYQEKFKSLKAKWSDGLGRKPEECTPDNDNQRIKTFSEAMHAKWQKGRKENGPVVKIDPLEEAMSECVDLANYAMDTWFRIQKLRTQMQDTVNAGKKV